MRFVLCILLLVFVAAPTIGPAFADEPTPPAADLPSEPPAAPPYQPKPDPTKALFIGESLMPGEDDVPEGWSTDDDATAAQGPEEEKLTAIAEGLGLGEDPFYVQLQSYRKGGDLVTVAMVDVDEKVYAYKHALAAQAATSGWDVSDLGHPGRILVIGGPAGAVADLKVKLRDHTIYALSEMAMNRIRGRAGNEEAGREAAVTYTKYIDSLVEDTGTANAIRGLVHHILSRKDMKKKDDKPNRAEQEKAVAFFAKAHADDAKFPPKGSVRVFTAAQLGGILLTWKDPSKLAQATRALELAVEHEKDGKRMGQRFESRYNLTCAYARAKRIDDAFEMLEKSLQVLKNMPPDQWRTSHKHAEEKDPDLGPLRDDPRFSKLMNSFKPPAPKKRRHHKPKSEKDGQ